MLLYSADFLHGQYAAAMKPVWIGALATLTAYVLYAAFYYFGTHKVLRGSKRFAGSTTTITLEDRGLRTANSCGESFTPWNAMQGIEETGDVLLLLFDDLYFFPVSTRAFSSTQEKQAFITYVGERIASAGGLTSAPATAVMIAEPIAQPATPVAAPTLATTLKAARKTFFISLGQAFKLAAFLPVAEARICVSWWQIPVFALLNLTLAFVWALIKVGTAGQFMWYSLPLVLFHLPVLLLAAIFIAYALRRADKTLLLIQVFLMIALAFDLIMTVISSAFGLHPTVFARPILGIPYFSLPSLWLALACFTAARRYTIPNPSRRLLAMAITLAVIALPLGVIYRQYNLWDRPYDDESAARANYDLSNEDLFYSQQKLLDQELASLQPERKGVTDVFFIGMAGYADQDVFMREVDSVARLFRERFDADGHIIRLVNNNKTLASLPIASTSSLKAALNRVAQVMNKDEDVLFLFLTSHGSASHQLAIELSPLNLNQLDPLYLRKLLDDSGIKNRVVVVSACYSGGFINALKDEHTLVISAAAPNKTSFGCSNENNWTYFDDAYFNHALRKTRSFVEAFNLAKPQIAAREQQEKFDPSDPQMALGAAMRDKLAALELQLATPQVSDHAVSVQDNQKVPDTIEQYVNLVYDPQDALQEYQACIANMHIRGPDAVLETNPGYFAGLNKSSPQWPRLVSAWDQYAEAFCTKLNDPDMMRGLYTKYMRANIPPQEMAPVLKFLTSDSGKHWYPAARKATRQMWTELAKIQNEIDAPLAKTYRDEQAQIYKAFYAEQRSADGKAAR